MRTDCTRDNRATPLPNASHLGFDLWKAKRGNWIRFEHNGRILHGRVLGGVTTTGGDDKGTRYVECVALLGTLDNPSPRWVKPFEILQCSPVPPKSVFEFICGPWDDVATILARVAYGIPSDNAKAKATK